MPLNIKAGIVKKPVILLGSCNRATLRMENTNFTHTAVYKKALEIFRVSRIIACAVSDNKHVVEMDLSADPNENMAGEIVTRSLRLVPELAAVHNCPNKMLQLKRAKKLRRSAKGLMARCKTMEFHNVKELEFIGLLKKELQQFDLLIIEWLYHLQLNHRKN